MFELDLSVDTAQKRAAASPESPPPKRQCEDDRPSTPQELRALRALIEEQDPRGVPPVAADGPRGVQKTPADGPVGLHNLKHLGLMRECGGVKAWLKSGAQL